MYKAIKLKNNNFLASTSIVHKRGGGWYYLNNLLDNIDTSITNINNSINNILDKVYPIGSIYLTMNATNPKDLFGGTWTQICQGRCLFGVGSPSDNNTNWCGTLNNSGYSFWAGEMGGQYNHYLTTSEMPAHCHKVTALNKNDNGYYPYNNNSDALCTLSYNWDFLYNMQTKGWSNSIAMQNTGGGGWHNNVMPYMAVYIWQRTG